MPDRAPYRCYVEIDLDALRANARFVRERLPRDCKVLAVVKAGGYGLGVGPVVQALESEVDWFAVANLSEAKELRTAHPVMILGPALAEERAEIIQRGYVPLVSSIEEAEGYNASAGKGKARMHFAVDTGMGRIGADDAVAVEILRSICSLPNVEVEGFHTHLPSADEDLTFTQAQLERWKELLEEMRKVCPGAVESHALNSAGILGFAAQPGDIVRAGLMLYGCSPLPSHQSFIRPVVSWYSRITLIRDVPEGHGISYGRTFITPRPMRVATVAVGYADGLPRSISGRGAAFLVQGKTCPMLGRVTMDQIMIDVSDLEKVQPGELVTLIGSDGDASVTVAEMAEWAGTIPWEILTGLQLRVQKIYSDFEGSKSLLA